MWIEGSRRVLDMRAKHLVRRARGTGRLSLIAGTPRVADRWADIAVRLGIAAAIPR
jgi:hypothetical protein